MGLEIRVCGCGQEYESSEWVHSSACPECVTPNYHRVGQFRPLAEYIDWLGRTPTEVPQAVWNPINNTVTTTTVQAPPAWQWIMEPEFGPDLETNG